MRVLVTGASGFVGRHLVALLADRGDEVVGWGLSPLGDDRTLQLDLLDPAAAARQDLSGTDAVIHLAGLAQVSRSFSEPARYVSDNAGMEIGLLEALLAQRQFPRVLVVSTGSVYRGGEELITETSPVEASNPYVVSKLTQELLGWYYAQRGFEVLVARPFNHVGPGQQRGYLVADLASQIAACEHAGGGEIRAGNLASSRDYTDVRDVAAAYLSLIAHGTAGEVYNVCSGRSRSGTEIAAALVKLTDAPITVRADATLERPTDTPDVRASSEKIRRETLWTPKIPLDRSLSDALAYWRKQTSGRG